MYDDDQQQAHRIDRDVTFTSAHFFPCIIAAPIAADFGTSRLFWNNGNGTFTDGTVAAGVGTDENGMGSTFGDYDLDGDLDWFATSIHDQNEPVGK